MFVGSAVLLKIAIGNRVFESGVSVNLIIIKIFERHPPNYSMAQFSLLVFKIKVLFWYPDAQWRHQICQNRKISWIFFGMLPCVPIKSLPHFSLQKRENCVLLTTLILVLLLLILPCKKIGRRKRGEHKKSLFKKSSTI